MEPIFKVKSDQELKTINTKNLLKYYKAERIRFFKYQSQFICECCGMFTWEINSKEENHKDIFDAWGKYLWVIKKELRERNIEDRLIK